MRRFAAVALLLAAVSCRSYDHPKYNSQQDGLLPADEFRPVRSGAGGRDGHRREFGRAGADTAEAYPGRRRWSDGRRGFERRPAGRDLRQRLGRARSTRSPTALQRPTPPGFSE